MSMFSSAFIFDEKSVKNRLIIEDHPKTNLLWVFLWIGLILAMHLISEYIKPQN